MVSCGLLNLHTEKTMNEYNELADDNRGQHIKKVAMGKILFNSI